MNRRGFLTGALATAAAASMPATAAPMNLTATQVAARIEAYGASPAMLAAGDMQTLMEMHRQAIIRAFLIPNHLLTPIEVCERETFLVVPSVALSKLAGANSPMAACVDEYERDGERRE